MNLPDPFIPKSDAENPQSPVAPSRIPTTIQAAGHMMISYDNPVEWGTEEEISELSSAQRTTWAGKKELGWTGVEYFKVVNEANGEEEVRLMAIPGSWKRANNIEVLALINQATANPDLLKNLAHGLVLHPDLSWEKPVSARDPHRIIKTILFRSLVLSQRKIPSNAQLNAAAEAILEQESVKDAILAAKKEEEPKSPILFLPEPPASTPEPTAPVAETAESPVPEQPTEEENFSREEILEVAKRLLPASRILESRGAVENAAQDALHGAKALLRALQK